MVIVLVDVSDWFLVAEWDARPESSEMMAARIVEASAVVRDTFPTFDGTWTVRDRVVACEDAGSWSAIIDASPYKVDGVAEPARGSALSMLSELEEGVFLRASVTAGATHQTTVNKPNEFALDFAGASFGAPIELELPEQARERFEQLGAELQRIWSAGELRVELG